MSRADNPCPGVTWDRSRNKWFASIRVNKKLRYLGRYGNFDDAVEARLKGEQDPWARRIVTKQKTVISAPKTARPLGPVTTVNQSRSYAEIFGKGR